MSSEQDKAKAFITRLLSNPTLNHFTVLQKEEQIIQFLHVNATQLQPTLSSPQFFPQKGWNQIFSLLIQSLYDIINSKLLPEIKRILSEKISYSFIAFLRQQNASQDKIQEQIFSILTSLLKKNEARRNFTGAFSAVTFNIIDRYINEIFSRKSYIHFELTKVQRLKMSKEDVKHLILATLILKPTINILSPDGVVSQQERMAGVVQGVFAEKVLNVLKKQLAILPEQVLRSAVNANVSFTENRFSEATSRIAAIFAARCRNYHPNVRVDRGADTPDKSWLSIARRNYKFYGFDIKMLDEFYQIAAENGW